MALAHRMERITVQQHIPGWSDVTSQRATVSNQAALLEDVSWIKAWARDDLVARNGVLSVRPWYRFSLADRELMAEFDEGRHCWVVAHVIEGVELLDLPAWIEHPDARRRREDWNKGITNT